MKWPWCPVGAHIRMHRGFTAGSRRYSCLQRLRLFLRQKFVSPTNINQFWVSANFSCSATTAEVITARSKTYSCQKRLRIALRCKIVRLSQSEIPNLIKPSSRFPTTAYYVITARYRSGKIANSFEGKIVSSSLKRLWIDLRYKIVSSNNNDLLIYSDDCLLILRSRLPLLRRSLVSLWRDFRTNVESSSFGDKVRNTHLTQELS